MNNGEKHVAWAIAILTLLGIGVLGANYYSIGGVNIPGLPKLTLTGGGVGQNINNATDQEKLAAGVGTFQAQVIGESSADPNAARTVGAAADFYVNWYSWSGQYDQYGQKIYSRMLTEIANPSATQDLLNMRPEFGGYVYAAITVPSGKYYYVDYAKMQEDSYIVGYQFFDIDNSGSNSFVFQYDMKGHYIPNQGFPVITFKVYLMDFDTGFSTVAGQSTTSGLNQLSDGTLANVTQGTNRPIDKLVKWSYNLTDPGDYIAFYQIELVISTTDLTQVSLKSMQIPGRGTVEAASFHKWQTASDIRYTITFSEASFDGALFTGLLPNAANNEFDLFTTLTCNLPSSEVKLTLNLYCLSAPDMSGFSTNSPAFILYT